MLHLSQMSEAGSSPAFGFFCNDPFCGRWGLLVAPEDPPEGVEHTRQPEEQSQNYVNEEVNVAPVYKEHGHRWENECTDQGHEAHAIAVTPDFAAALSFAHL